MISGRNNSRCSTSAYVFTASQWQELEQQLLTFKYIMSGVPIPPELISTVIRNPLTCSSSRLFPHQQSFPFGWGCFQVGYGRKIDFEPGRCRRTDGKKWRCTKEACPDSKYCERHMHRGKNKTKKPSFQVFLATNNTNTATTTTPTPTTIDQSLLSSTHSPPTPVNNHIKTAYFSSSSSSSPATSCPVSTVVYPHYKTQKLQSSSFYPFLSPNDQTPSFSTDFITTESANQHNNNAPPHWLLDPHSYDQHPKKDIRGTLRNIWVQLSGVDHCYAGLQQSSNALCATLRHTWSQCSGVHHQPCRSVPSICSRKKDTIYQAKFWRTIAYYVFWRSTITMAC